MSFQLFGKPRTKLGNFIDKRRIKQSLLEEWTKKKVSRTIISKMCSDRNYCPTTDKVNHILNVLRKHVDKNVDYEDFWM